jgi:hypothetical protein
MHTLQSVRRQLAERRTARHQRKQLARELGAYDTPSARLEIETIVSRYDTAEIPEIKSILQRQAGRRLLRTGR